MDFVNRRIIPAAYALLPYRMADYHATALLLSIGLQESGFVTRRQGGGGPARGFWQFERGGVLGVLTHAASGRYVSPVLEALAYPPDPEGGVYELLEHNDVIAAVVARLLLWTDKAPLPPRDDPSGAWKLYLRLWRPGRPHPDTWAANYARAWAAIDADMVP